MTEGAKYLLLKDLPFVKAGAIFEPFTASARVVYVTLDSDNEIVFAIKKDFVIDNKDWFQEMEQEIEAI